MNTFSHKSDGFSLVEISLAIVVIAVGLSVVVVMFPAGLGQNSIATGETQAAQFAEDVFNQLQVMANSRSWADFKDDAKSFTVSDSLSIATPNLIELDNKIHTIKYKLQGNAFDDYTLRYRINTNHRTAAICKVVNEGGTLTLTAPAGSEITSIDFASYGTPSGNCTDGYIIGGCHAVLSYQKVADLANLPQPSISISANNGTFGDPCGGTAKKLAVEATVSYINIDGSRDELLPVTIDVWPGEYTTPTKEYKVTFYSEIYDSGL